MGAVYEREIKSYFRGPMGYIVIAFVLLFAGIYTMVVHLYSMLANFEYVLSNMSFLYLLAVPVLTMRLIAEERRQKTDQLLYSLPLSMGKIVLGKYLAAVTVLAIPLGIVGLYPLLLSLYGEIYLPMAYGSLLAFFLLGAALIAVGMLVSALTENQIVAAVGGFLLILLNYFLGDLSAYIPSTSIASFLAFTALIALVAMLLQWMTGNGVLSVGFAVVAEGALFVLLLVKGEALAGSFPALLQKIALFDRFYNFIYGMFDWTTVVFYGSVGVFFLFLTVQSLEKRRWS